MDVRFFDLIVIGAGSGGLSVGLFMSMTGLRVLMISRSDGEIGGECLNDGCIPSKALIHASRVIHNAKTAAGYGIGSTGTVDIKKVMGYVSSRQDIIRRHENARWLTDQGITVEIGEAKFTGKNELEINGKRFSAPKIVIATGSKPRKLNIPGVERVKYFDNENIFKIDFLPEKLLVIGGGPIGIEIGQAFSRLGSKVMVVEAGNCILKNDDRALTDVLLGRLREEGIEFFFRANPESFPASDEINVRLETGETVKINFDAVFAGIGRSLDLEPLNLSAAGIEVKSNKIVTNDFLATTNKNVFVCGDVAGDLLFSHSAEMQGRVLLNNFFSPVKKKPDKTKMSWVTFSDPELASFGLNESQLREKNIPFEKLEQSFRDDDRAVTDDYRYSKLILYLSEKSWFRKQVVLGGTMLAPGAGELVQELILANFAGISINEIFNKIYPYPVASRINQLALMNYKQKDLTPFMKGILKFLFKTLR